MNKEYTIAQIKDIAVRLHNPSVFGGVSLIVGAGFSKNAQCVDGRTTPPDLSELAERMYEELYTVPEEEDKITEWKEKRKLKTSGKNILHLADEYISNFGRTKMDMLIEKSVSDDLFYPGKLHERLLNLNWTDVFTTNYDTLLERTITECVVKNNYKFVISKDNLPGSRGGNPRIIKLHGSIPGVRPYIISEEDFRCYPQKYAPFVNTVQQALIETTLCMIGFSGNDPDFLSWHGWLRDNLGDNCPKIYLIGIYDDMYESERKILLDKNITPVNLNDLLNDKDKNDYKKAYLTFFDEIDANKKESLLEKKPQAFKNRIKSLSERSVREKELELFITYCDSFIKSYDDVALLPQRIRNTYKSFFYQSFEGIMASCNKNDKGLFEALADLIIILRKCFQILFDYHADKLLSLVEPCDGDSEVIPYDQLFQILLYLLEMYRIDSNDDMYLDIVERCEKIKSFLNESNLDLYYLEKSKYYASLFDITEVKNNLRLIKGVSLKTKIAKAGLYVQIGEYDSCNILLKECLDDLRKTRNGNDAFNASYKSYISLCYYSYNWGFIKNKEYDDTEYRNNEYRTRNIILKLINELSGEIIKSHADEEIRENVFEVNYYKGKPIVFGLESIKEKSFEFVLMLDTLCLPVFSDQSILVPDAINEIIYSSADKYWKLSFMARLNNSNAIERCFSRRSLSMFDRNELARLYDKIWNCISSNGFNNYNYHRLFLTQKNALDVLSRIVVYLDDDRIIDFLNYIIDISGGLNDVEINDIRRILKRLSTRFNANVFESLYDGIFVKSDIRLFLSSYFTQKEYSIKNSGIYYNKAFTLIKDNNDDCIMDGLNNLLVLWKNKPNNRYKGSIISLLWKNKSDTFPEYNNVFKGVWEELPHPDSVSFEQLYKDYIYDGIVNINQNTDVFKYANLFYHTSGINESIYSIVKFNNDEIKKMLSSIESFLNDDKDEVREFDLFDSNDNKDQFRYISEFVSMIYAYAYKNHIISGVKSIIDRIVKLLIDKEVRCVAINAIKYMVNNKVEEALNMIDTAICSNDERVSIETMIGLQLVYYLSKNKKDKDTIYKYVTTLLNELKFFDIKNAKVIWLQLKTTLLMICKDRKVIDYQLTNAFYDCIASYSARGVKGDKYYYEALYNCNKAMRELVDGLESKGITARDSFGNSIDLIKSFDLPELLVLWE